MINSSELDILVIKIINLDNEKRKIKKFKIKELIMEYIKSQEEIKTKRDTLEYITYQKSHNQLLTIKKILNGKREF